MEKDINGEICSFFEFTFSHWFSHNGGGKTTPKSKYTYEKLREYLGHRDVEKGFPCCRISDDATTCRVR